MKIATFQNDKIKKRLKDAGFDVKNFEKTDEFLKYIANYDVVIINSTSLIKKIKNIAPHAILILVTNKEKTKEKFLNEVDFFLNKETNPLDFIKIMNLIKKLISYKIKSKKIEKVLNEKIEYQLSQEKLATIKQKKLIKNDLKNFFEKEHLFDNYTLSKDMLNGDSLFSIYISENEYLLGIIDAMGKGLNASLTSINCVSFVEYSIKKALEYNDFNFERLIKDFVNYAKSIITKEERLCAIILHIKDNKIEFANFGMPPIYTQNEKFLANNPSISQNRDTYKIDTIDLPDKFIILSDGLLESKLKEKELPYFARFKKIYKNTSFLTELIEDFKKNAIQTDDVSIVYYTKDSIYKKIYSIKKTISTISDIDEILLEVDKLNLPQKELNFILQEMLMNTFEHSLYNLKKNKTINSIKNSKKVKDYVKIKLDFYKNDKFLKLHYIEESEGFNKEEIDIEAKYHGKGLKIIKKLSAGFFMNHKGNEIKIFLKEN